MWKCGVFRALPRIPISIFLNQLILSGIMPKANSADIYLPSRTLLATLSSPLFASLGHFSCSRILYFPLLHPQDDCSRIRNRHLKLAFLRNFTLRKSQGLHPLHTLQSRMKKPSGRFGAARVVASVISGFERSIES